MFVTPLIRHTTVLLVLVPQYYIVYKTLVYFADIYKFHM